jgi:DMSO/TMAO reductase YedYZ molybdopterin-dependent catalytic subunit
MRVHLAVTSVVLIGSSQAALPLIDPGDRVQEVADTLKVLRVAGEVRSPLSLTLADIAALPHQEVLAEIHGRSVKYRGVELGELLLQAGLPEGREVVRTIVVARATDGYEAVFYLAELTPDFTDRIVLVADERDGESLPGTEGPVRLVVPGEKEAARWVRQLREIEVRRVR